MSCFLVSHLVTCLGLENVHIPMFRVENNCHIPDLVQAFFEEHGGLNQVLQHAKPPSYMTAIHSLLY
jgi:hypothetical protein